MKVHIWSEHKELVGVVGEMVFNVPALLLQHLDRIPLTNGRPASVTIVGARPEPFFGCC